MEVKSGKSLQFSNTVSSGSLNVQGDNNSYTGGTLSLGGTGSSLGNVSVYFGATLQVGGTASATSVYGDYNYSGGGLQVERHAERLRPVFLIQRHAAGERGPDRLLQLQTYGGDADVTGTVTATGSDGSVSNTLSGTGSFLTRARLLSLNSGVSPGVAGPGTLSVGNVSLIGGLTAQLNGTAPGQFDQLNVTGTAAVAGTLNLSLGYVPNINSTWTIVNNDSNDPISGTFLNLPEGGLVAAGGETLRISYVGGDGNDVVLTALTGITPGDTFVTLTSGDLVINDLVSGGKSDTLTIQRPSGNNVVISDPNWVVGAGSGMTQVDSHTVQVPLSSITGQITMNTLAGNDTLTIAFGNGDPLPAGGISFDGGAGGNDALRITGTGLAAVYTPSAETTNGDGSIVIGGKTIGFTGLEPIDYDVVGGTFTLMLPGDDDVVDVSNSTLIDGSTLALKISGSSGGTPFENARVPSGEAIVIDTTTVAGTDMITITSANNADTNTGLTVTAGTEAGDTITVNGTATFSGTTTLDAKTVTLNANVTNTVTGTTATVVNVTSPGQIQDGVNVAASGATVNVAAGTYTELVSTARP